MTDLFLHSSLFHFLRKRKSAIGVQETEYRCQNSLFSAMVHVPAEANI